MKLLLCLLYVISMTGNAQDVVKAANDFLQSTGCKGKIKCPISN